MSRVTPSLCQFMAVHGVWRGKHGAWVQNPVLESLWRGGGPRGCGLEPWAPAPGSREAAPLGGSIALADAPSSSAAGPPPHPASQAPLPSPPGGSPRARGLQGSFKAGDGGEGSRPSCSSSPLALRASADGRRGPRVPRRPGVKGQACPRRAGTLTMRGTCRSRG